MSRDPDYTQDYRERTNQDAVERARKLEAALWEIAAMQTPWSNATVKRMAATARAALTDAT